MPPGLKQYRNEQLVRNLTSDFQSKYDAAFAWSRACAMYQALPGLRGFWPMSSFNESGNAYDLSGQGRTLTYNGNPLYNWQSLAPYIAFDGTGDWLSRADEAGLDILGTEAYVGGGVRGLTLGGWFMRQDTNAAGLICKTDGTYAYHLDWGAVVANSYHFRIYDAGGVGYAVSIADTATSVWKFVVGRFTPSTEVKIWVNDDTNTNVVAIPAAIRNTAANFLIGAITTAPAADMYGRASMCFLCAMALSDTIILSLFEHTKAMFNVR